MADRYVLARPLGHGGAGVVYRAYDRELDRDVAVKFVGTGTGDTSEPRTHAQARLLREAQAAASLSHPNVVTIYDVGTVDDDVFVAMELIVGLDLRTWLRQRQASWNQVVDAFVAAGKGLAAAHAAGLMHLDFKPTNVLVGDDERVRVLDFGLAKPAVSLDPSRSRSDGRHSQAGSTLALDADPSVTEHVAGTPAYMAPEQHRGRGLGPWTDQFGFCVSLFEALWGSRPFQAKDFRTLATHKVLGHVTIPSESPEIPRWLRRVVLRGLDPEPAKRWPSMDVLIERLHRGGSSGRRLVLLATGAGGALLTAAVGWPAPRADSGCMDEHTWLQGVWDEGVRQRGHDAFGASGLPYAEDSWERVEGIVEDKVQGWVDARQSVCEAGVGDPGFDRRVSCLDAHRQELEVVAALWTQPTDETIARAVQTAGGLPEADSCVDSETLEPRAEFGPYDPATRKAAARLRDRLAHVRGLIEAGSFSRASELAAPLVEEAEALGQPSLLAETLYRYGNALVRIAQYDRGEEVLSRAYFLALDQNLHRWSFESASTLAYVSGLGQGDIEAANAWIRHAQSAIERGKLPPSADVRLAHVHGSVLSQAGRLQDQIRVLREALALAGSRGGPEAITVGEVMGALSEALLAVGQLEQAQEVAVAAVKILEHELGSHHPWISQAQRVLTAVLAERGLHEEAMLSAKRAVRLLEGNEDRTLAAAIIDVGSCHRRAGQPQQARAQFERALEILESIEGDHTDTVAVVLNNLGGVALAQENWEDAIQWFDRSATMLQAAVGSDDVRLAVPLFNRAEPYAQLGQYERALEDIVRGQTILTNAYGGEHPKMALVLRARGEVEGMLERYEDAQHHLERSIELGTQRDLDPVAIAESQFKLALVLFNSKRDVPRAMALAMEARATYLARAPDEPLRQTIEQWLREHRY